MEVYRSQSSDLGKRIMTENKAKRFYMDALETTLPLQKLLPESKMMTPFTSPHLTRYPDIAERKADKSLYPWAVDSGLTINNTSIPAASVKITTKIC